jgi:hypothetical protein
MTKQMEQLNGGEVPRKRTKAAKPDGERPKSRKRGKPEVVAVATPETTRKPKGKRDRSGSGSDQGNVSVQDYERMLAKITATAAGEQMIDNFMGAGFLKKARGISDDEMEEGEIDDGEESDEESSSHSE